jgi:gamma-glutamylcyclotransferase (GGCT)/AIG2-like uncharacterized protein YtfP
MCHLYFAYGLNLDGVEMAHRCPGVEYAGRGRLAHHAFRINRRGVATVVGSRGTEVHGALWRVSDVHLRVLDEFEGTDLGLYVRQRREIHFETSTPEAHIYVATDMRGGSPRPGYLETIIAAAEDLGLPSAYIDELRKWLAPTRSVSVPTSRRREP